MINMRVKTIKVSDKGQISIPQDIREEIGIKKGDELILIEDKGKIMLERPEKIAKNILNSFTVLASEKSLAKDWLSKEDEEAWNDL